MRALMSLYEGAKTIVRVVGLELSEEFEVKVGVHQDSYCCSWFLRS